MVFGLKIPFFNDFPPAINILLPFLLLFPVNYQLAQIAKLADWAAECRADQVDVTGDHLAQPVLV